MVHRVPVAGVFIALEVRKVNDKGKGKCIRVGQLEPFAQGQMPLAGLLPTLDGLSEGLVSSMRDLTGSVGRSLDEVVAVGLASPGLFKRSGEYTVPANLPFLKGKNLRTSLESRLKKPVAIDNDANAGGLAEWEAIRTEFFYWVLGGGWGGAWMSASGEVQFPTWDWDGNDRTLHLSNEPGYATALDIGELRSILANDGVEFGRLESILRDESDRLLCGPGGDPLSLRAETLVSGSGMLRLFKAAGPIESSAHRRVVEGSEPGRLIDELAGAKEDRALLTYRIFGTLFAWAGSLVLRQAVADGAPPDTAIHLAGKPAFALQYFKPSFQNELSKRGYGSLLQTAVIHERKLNANLIGAGALARRAVEDKR